MASSYPGALESFTNPASTDDLNTSGVLHDVQHADANDAIEAIEATLGVDPQGSFATVAAAIAAIAAIGPTGANMGTSTATSSNGTATSGATETRDAVLGNYTFTALAGRRYRAILDSGGIYTTSAGDTVLMRIRNGGASTPTASSTLIATGGGPIPAAGVGMTFSCAGTFAPGAGTVTLSVFCVRASGAGVEACCGSRELYAIDLGPA